MTRHNTTIRLSTPPSAKERARGTPKRFFGASISGAAMVPLDDGRSLKVGMKGGRGYCTHQYITLCAGGQDKGIRQTRLAPVASVASPILVINRTTSGFSQRETTLEFRVLAWSHPKTNHVYPES